MAINASENGIANARIDKKEIGLVIVASFSQDYLFPPMSAKIHSYFELVKDCQIIDVNTKVRRLRRSTIVLSFFRSPKVRFIEFSSKTSINGS